MLTYNTQRKKLVLPEYGRNIQQMVDYCVTIEDRAERNHCAYSIINTMGNLFPELRDEADYKHKLWDHLAIMSDFKLDIDYPYPVVNETALDTRPDAVNYRLEKIKLRHYGKIMERMINRAAEYPEGEERNALIMLLANHMKKTITQISTEAVEDAKIFKDLEAYSGGKIKLDPAVHVLHEYKAPHRQQQGKKKKK